MLTSDAMESILLNVEKKQHIRQRLVLDILYIKKDRK